MREIKFRVAEFDDEGKFCDYTYIDTKESFDSRWLDYTDNSQEIQFYTGLNDKNGKEIYEADILQHVTFIGERKEKYKVEWIINGFQYVRLTDNALCYEASEYIEVIGNEYENPELLKVK